MAIFHVGGRDTSKLGRIPRAGNAAEPVARLAPGVHIAGRLGIEVRVGADPNACENEPAFQDIEPQPVPATVRPGSPPST